jgi:hypothetical protein
VSVKAVPLVITSFAFGPVASLMVQTYVLAEENAPAPLRVTVLGPFVFAIVNVPVTTCCVGRSEPLLV